MGQFSHSPAASSAEVKVSVDGMRVGHLGAGVLRVFDLASGQTQLLGEGVDDYAMDRNGRVFVWRSQGRLYRTQGTSAVETPTVGVASHAQPDPTGQRIGYVSDGTVRVIQPDGRDELLAGEGDGVRWGERDATAAFFERDAGWWWSPDSETIMATRAQGEQISLHLLDLDGGWVDVHWDREIYPYLGSVRWHDGSPLITVLRRSQAHGLVLAVDRRTGETQVHAELADPRWVNPVPGTPRHMADGRVLVGGEIAHDGYDARCLFADGTLLTPPGLYVRRVVGRLGVRAAGGELGDILVEASDGEPAEQHLFRVRGASSAGMVVHKLPSEPGWHYAVCGGDTVVTGHRSTGHVGVQWSVWHAGELVGELSGAQPVPEGTPRPVLDRVTDRRLPSAVLYPSGHVFGRRLPVLLLLPDTPTEQQVRVDHAAFERARHWAELGFAVVAVDGRGSFGVAPSFEKVTHRRVADLALADQVDGLRALADKHADLDLSRVTALGRGYGGWLAGLLAADRSEAVHTAIALDPWDWTEVSVPLAERYLGPREFDSDVYLRHRMPELPQTVLVASDVDDQTALGFIAKWSGHAG